MEDMARLALVEQDVRDPDTFSKILYELLRHINRILESPHDYEQRTIRSEVLKKVLQHQAFVDYLKSIGFQAEGSKYTYPKDSPLSNLRMAQAAIERKIYFCCGSVSHTEGRVKFGHNLPQARKPKLVPVKVLHTSNPFLLRIESMFNDMIKYEDEDLQELAREHIPIVTLQLMALDRLRDHQKKIKQGETKSPDMAFDIALLMELLGWFKHEFFTWVDRPPCDSCDGPTTHVRNTTELVDGETCRVEHYKCVACGAGACFPRYNSARNLLRSRAGRCGEWANCFALLCRALGYDTRYCYDTTDHVWCEVFDYDSNTWLHVDPCEGKLNAPLMYAHGWGKTISYVVALSKDDVQDVTWRYTVKHNEVLKRRNLCSEDQLVACILNLREARQSSLSEARKRYLAKRTLCEVIELMLERKPSDYESHGRISGSAEWRGVRGETGAGGHVFTLKEGTHHIRYHCADDVYRITRDKEKEVSELNSWSSGVFIAQNIQRTVERDWQMVYLARQDGNTEGVLSWRIEASAGMKLTAVTVTALSAEFDSGTVTWSVAVDDKEADVVCVSDSPTTIAQNCITTTLTARLRGGSGDVAWQHAQVCRQHALAATHAMQIVAVVAKKDA